MPDEVALDLLATPELPDSDAQAEFLNGLASDLNQVTNPEPPELVAARTQDLVSGNRLVVPARFQAGGSPVNEFRRIYTGVASLTPATFLPTDPDAAVIDTKIRAIREGLLDPKTPLDPTWGPDVASARRELLYAEMNRRMSGQRPGALTLGKVLDVMDEWLAPSSLIATVLGLDLIPSIGKLESETKNWFGNLKKWVHDPLDPKKFVAALGPLDDILLPALNTYLMFTGFTGVIKFAQGFRALRAGEAVVSAGAEAGFFSRVLGGAGTTIGEEVAAFERPGFVSRYLTMHGATPIATGTGEALASWRKLSGVILAKKAMQQGMRVGFVGKVGAELFPDREGYGLGTLLGVDGKVKDRIETFKEFRTNNPLGVAVAQVMDLPFFIPPHIFAPGTVSGPAQRFAEAVRSRLIDVSRDERLTSAFYQGVVAAFLRQGSVSDAERAFMHARRHSPSDVVALILNGVRPDEFDLVPVTDDMREKAGMIMSYVVGVAAIDKAAAEEATRVAEVGTARWYEAFFATRDHYKARLTRWDDGLLDWEDPHAHTKLNKFKNWFSGLLSNDYDYLEGSVWERADQVLGEAVDEAGSVLEARTRVAEGLRQLFWEDPEAFRMLANQHILHHNSLATATWNDLLDTLTPADVIDKVTETIDTFANWDDFVASVHQVKQYVEALPEEQIKFILPREITGTWKPNWLPELFNEDLFKGLPTSRNYDAMAKRLAAGHAEVTVAKLDTPTKQDAQLLRGRILALQELSAQLGETTPEGVVKMEDEFFGLLDDFAKGKEKTIADLTDQEIEAFLKKHTKYYKLLGYTRDQVRTFTKALRFLGDVSPTEAKKMIDRWLKQINENVDLWSRLKVPSRVLVGTNTRSTTLSEKLKLLKDAEKFLAAELDVDPEFRAMLAAAGYKPVVGVDFIQPFDLIGLKSPFTSITERTLRRASLGTFLSRDYNTHEAISKLRHSKWRLELAAIVDKYKKQGRWDGPDWFDASILSRHPEDLWRLLRSYRSAMMSDARNAREISSGLSTRILTNAAHSGLPHSTYDLRPDAIDRALNGNPDFRNPADVVEWGPNSREAIIASLRRAKLIGFAYQGLQQLQDEVVAHSWLRSVLRTFAYSEAADDASRVAQVKQFLGIGESPRAGATSLDAHLWRAYKRAGVSLLYGLVGMNQVHDQNASLKEQLLAGGAAAAFGALTAGHQPLAETVRNVARAGLFQAGTTLAASSGVPDEAAPFVGLAAATVGLGGIRRALTLARQQGKFFGRGWAEYSRLSDAAIDLRDRIRFSLSPVFDIQRYTEGLTLGITANDTDIPLPLTFSPMKKAMKELGMSRAEILAQFRNAGQESWMDAVESTQAWFFEEGIMGFSPLDWMAATHARFVAAGMDPFEAADKVHDIYTYGVKGRSGLEMSVNFVFFPFSFQKKYLTHVSKFVMSDLGRAMLIHDSIKTWDTLNERYDLPARWRDQLPILTQLWKVNSLAFGFSPGQLGGINRLYLDVIRSTPKVAEAHDAVVNLFLPQALQIHSEADSKKLTKVMGRVVPILRDTQDLIRDTVETGYALWASPVHRVRRAEADAGWEEYNKLRKLVNEAARRSGFSLSQVLSGSPRYAPFRLWYDQQLAEIAKKYPAWQEARIRASQSIVRKEAELADIVKT
ncbi:MAG: hypothetical protein D6746_04185, partial [Bacteroidetes bacterium]